MAGITLLGLGPGDPGLLTYQAWGLIQHSSEIYLRTSQHPTVAGFPKGLQVHSFDALYETLETFEQVYAEVIAQVLELGQRPSGVLYAVPGHPFIAEATGPEIARQARARGIPVRVVEGLSFIEPTFTALGVDPLPRLTLLDALELAAGHHPGFPPDAPALIAQLYSREVAADVKLTLMNIYPDEHPVRLVHAAGTPQEQVEALALYQIDRSPHIGLLSTLYLPALGPYTAFEALQEIAAHLRAPEGCPWDQEQTYQSLRPHLLEEVYEALDAIDAENPTKMREEFGDLMLMVAMYAQIGSELGDFNSAEIISGINHKLIRRHPHVFASLAVDGVGTVLKNWEAIKADERKANGEAGKGLLDGVSKTLPALTQAQEYQGRAARVGFDWPEIQGVLDKVGEEIDELRQASNDTEQAAELGDLFFALVNLARWYEIDAESALREANARFRQRFTLVEDGARQQGRPLADMSLAELDTLWENAKNQTEWRN